MSRKRREKRAAAHAKHQRWLAQAERVEAGTEYVLTAPRFIGNFADPARLPRRTRRHQAEIPHEQRGPYMIGSVTHLTLGLGQPYIDGKPATSEEVREWWKALGYADENVRVLETGEAYILAEPAKLGYFPIRKDVDIIPAEVQKGHGPLPFFGPPTVLSNGSSGASGWSINGKPATSEEVREWWKALGYTDEDFV